MTQIADAKDIVLAIFSGSLGISGLLLALVGVFYGVFAAFSDPPDDRPPICAALKRASWFLILVLTVNTVVSVLSLRWLSTQSVTFFPLILILTGVEIVGILAIATYIVSRFMR